MTIGTFEPTTDAESNCSPITISLQADAVTINGVAFQVQPTLKALSDAIGCPHSEKNRVYIQDPKNYRFYWHEKGITAIGTDELINSIQIKTARDGCWYFPSHPIFESRFANHGFKGTLDVAGKRVSAIADRSIWLDILGHVGVTPREKEFPHFQTGIPSICRHEGRSCLVLRFDDNFYRKQE
jgi:hypothetical protein